MGGDGRLRPEKQDRRPDHKRAFRGDPEDAYWGSLESAVATLVELGYDIWFLLSLDVLSFNDLATLAVKARNRTMIEQAISMRVAFNGDQKAWKEWMKGYEDPDLKASQVKGADDFAKAFGGS